MNGEASAAPADRPFDAGLQKVGFQPRETRDLIRAAARGPAGETRPQFVARVYREGSLGKVSERRVTNLMRGFYPRFVKPGVDLVELDALLERLPEADGRMILFWYLARSSGAMRALITGFLNPAFAAGAPDVGPAEANAWLAKELGERGLTWSLNSRLRVVRSALAALRDGGLVGGATHSSRKTLLQPRVSLAVALYVLHTLVSGGARGAPALMGHEDWALLTLSRADVEGLMRDLDARGALSFAVAGSIVRLDLRPFPEALDAVL